MEKEAARNLVEKVFNSAYSNDNFIELISNILKGYNRDDFKEINLSDDQKIFSKVSLIGTKKFGIDKIGIYEVELKTSSSLNRARVSQRNLIANELKINDFTSAIVSYFAPGTNEWRFSYVKFERSIDSSSGKVKYINEITPTKRKSFIAGVNEGTHTVQKQIVPHLHSNELANFSDIESIFEIEAVNDDFFEQYKELYLKLNDYLNDFIKKDPVISSDFKLKNISSSDFAKKTLGQFIFLYFLQKKGWIKNNFAPNEHFSFTKLFKSRKNYGDNFFNDVIEPIFYEALGNKSQDFDSIKVLNDFSFPYLNGGLFEPIKDYDWKLTNIIIPDDFFYNQNKLPNGEVGDGLINVFNRYNFTVYESDPIEQDIAVDPEMLGKIFERLQPVKDRHSKAAYYTPREVVSYMCKESIYKYISNNSASVNENPIFISTLIFDHVNLQTYLKDDNFHKFLEINAQKIDELLDTFYLCDPAVGSGAFLIGMLHEITEIRSYLTEFVNSKKTKYELKKVCIEKNLYGVDIDSSAVDIARLRLWLSLIVDEDLSDQVQPLPNLDYKISVGNSLIGFPFDTQYRDEIISELIDFQNKFILTSNKKTKDKLRNKINDLIKNVYINPSLFDSIGYLVDFDFELSFAEVFNRKKGFDIVLANPPYLESRSKDFDKDLKDKYQQFLSQKWGDSSNLIPSGSDLMMYFYPRALNILNRNGVAAFITENSWLDTDYGAKCQQFMIDHASISIILDSKYKYFSSKDAPKIHTIISIFELNSSENKNLRFIHCNTNIVNLRESLLVSNYENNLNFDSKTFKITSDELRINKWGFLFRSPLWSVQLKSKLELIANENKKIFRFGQGVNLTQDSIVSREIIDTLNIPENYLIPIFHKDKPSYFYEEPIFYLIDEDLLDKEYKKILKENKLGVYKKTNRDHPLLILPRGISDIHFSSLNNVNGLSASCVEIYSNTKISNEMYMALWAYTNSSVFWLFRELTGRHNLGQGLLKSEATDMNRLPMPIGKISLNPELEKVFNLHKGKSPSKTVELITDPLHIKLDQMIFDSLEIDEEIRIKIVRQLEFQINTRTKKHLN